MLKIFKKLIKSNFNHDKKYVLFYKKSMYDDYDFIRCDEKELKRILAVNDMYDYHIFLSKDELEIETEFKIEEK